MAESKTSSWSYATTKATRPRASLRPANLTVATWFQFSSLPGITQLVGKTDGNGILDSFALYRYNNTLNAYISDTAKYGDLTRGPRVVNKATKKEMKKILGEIQDGSFARVWIRENKTGRKKYDALMKKDMAHPIEKVGVQLRARMPWLNQA